MGGSLSASTPPRAGYSGGNPGAEPRPPLTALPLSQEPEPSPSRQSHLALEDIQILCLELEKQQLQQEEDEPQKLPPQPPYYDLGASPSHHPLVRTPEP
ncbi:hypothetical protein Celaphus_00009011 [Cervus elaphus hippelaphus]|uniref:Uncharacterized protein n=1 Tax=Cervus elaphus hippelaphus TaxID=46360 RepID=A0A212DHH6_CEREH|nr:hypothetical protein Celaphus_00009011 [Cervus elaphus hippelaphus]